MAHPDPFPRLTPDLCRDLFGAPLSALFVMLNNHASGKPTTSVNQLMRISRYQEPTILETLRILQEFGLVEPADKPGDWRLTQEHDSHV